MLLLQLPRDTNPVIPQTRLKVPFARPAGSIAFLDPPAVGLVSEAPVREPLIHAEVGRYRMRLAETREDRDSRLPAALQGVQSSSWARGWRALTRRLGHGPIRFRCEHLLVEDRLEAFPPGALWALTGCSRAQRRANLGYYSEQEFSFVPYEPLRADILELGRASIDREHRTPEVLTLLWRGIAQYASEMGLRYLLAAHR